ncbi:AAA domain-containing protein, putative AbiEii toxin, Type IV TA system [Paraburkholderia steynii]|uniref:AAA domain-containing protein, putative AbiEii toxin, Type IV TA system n=1 Tax=Paraburkholderia steynii TaxID=1245441 RepID=A0A7Z7BHA7_9BURK|nr:AAA family ATPase [Paraburkholderia steynii]SDJ22483.1 AAA domain-containing protein, putative AbiEii toxin, Type IV TA system [Paraburkholderia steynii]
MDTLRETDIIATRFWQGFLKLSSDLGDTRKIKIHLEAMVCLYVHAVSYREPSGSGLIEALFDRRLLVNESYANISSDSEIFAWLRASHPAEFRERMNGLVSAVREAFHHDRVEETLIAPGDEEAALTRFSFVYEWLRKVDEEFIPPVFDLGLARLAAPGVDFAREAFCARLASALLPLGSHTLVDMFGVTGQFPIQAAKVAGQSLRVLTGVRRDWLGFARDMRLRMDAIRNEELPSPASQEELFEWPHHRVDLALINPPGRRFHRDEIASLVENRPWSRPPSALSFAHEAMLTHARFDLMLVIVPRSDGQSSQVRFRPRDELVRGGHVVAVIDLPRSASGQKSAKFSAWLIRKDGPGFQLGKETILFIDTEPLAHLGFSEHGKAVASFVGRLVALCTERIDFDHAPFEPSGKGEHLLQNIFAREFGSGYRNVPGLCQQVPVWHVVENECRLVAQAYLQSKGQDDFLARVDRAIVNRYLDDESASGKRIYVIGNNGEGKSFLLQDIAHETAVKKRRKVVAISFGAIDRFPRLLKGQGASFYTYMGARTSMAGINIRDAAVMAGRLMLEIHASPEKKAIFDEIAQLAGFESELYLMPRGIGRNAHADGGLIGGVVRLNADEAIDRERAVSLQESPAASRMYKLGLKRRQDRGSITPFDELSSGEQQIIMLAAKMVRYASSGTLFLVDEPEISLHVSWQRAIPKIFTTIGRRFRADVLVATHSPIVISGALESDDHCFTLRDVTLQPLDEESRRSVETALFEGFRTYTTNNREVHERCASLVAEFIDVANRDQVAQDVGNDILGQLGEMRRIVEDGRTFDSRDTAVADIDLIEKAQAAITEIRDVKASRN